MKHFFDKALLHGQLNLSTCFTLIRIILVPIVVLSMFKQQWGVAFSLFVFAAATDLIDGFLARYLDQRTVLGACLDPIADKLLLLAVFFTLAFVETPLFAIPRWFVFLILLKEVIAVVGFLVLWALKGSIPEVRPTVLGKVTTFVQVLFIMWLFGCYFFKWLPIKTYYSVLGIVSVLVLATCLQYISLGFNSLKQGTKYL